MQESPARPTPSLDPERTLLPDGLVVLHMDEEGHLFITEGDVRHTRRLTWDPDDFSVLPGMPSLPGATGELEDSHVFAHPAPSADGTRVALFGLLPTLGEDEAWDGSPWEIVEEQFPYLATENWPPEDEEDTLPDDVAGLAMSMLEGDPDAIDEDAVVLSVEEAEEEEYGESPEEEGLPIYWPGGKVYVLHRDGVQVWEPWEFEAGNPTHLEWAPDDRHLMVLCQQERELDCLLIDAEEPGRGRLLMTGAPIFWDWRPGHNSLVLRSGFENRAAGIFLFDPAAPGSPDPHQIAEAGNFYVPAWHPDGECFVYGAPGSQEDELLLADSEGKTLKHFHSYPGRAAFRWDPSGRRLGVAVAPEGHGPLQRLEVLELATNSVLEVWHHPFIAFEWLPDGALLICQANEETGVLRWVRLHPDHPDSPLLLGMPWAPARESIISLHFFEQIKRSHPFLSADGRQVVYSGWLLDDLDGSSGDFAVHGSPEVLVTPLDGGETLRVARGRFGVFGGPR
ncbi:MAG: hypothetical protein VX498_07035 [Myxococcota bacterium]|nr:hypothetical protein [Myxococcota bacterium]